MRLGRDRRFRTSAVEEWLRELETGGIGPVEPAVVAHRSAPGRIRRASLRQTQNPPVRGRAAIGDGAESRITAPLRRPRCCKSANIDGQLVDTFGSLCAPPG